MLGWRGEWVAGLKRIDVVSGVLGWSVWVVGMSDLRGGWDGWVRELEDWVGLMLVR